ncbi:MAG: response regulator [Bdellovibrionales bacterium]|nr:response regulator [Bdellovibrionales bacterium]
MTDQSLEACQILIVDDEPRNIRILEEILEDYRIQTASTGDECLRLLQGMIPKIIFLDVMMPGIDGYEVCRRIKGDAKFNDTKVFLVSGKAMEEERQEGLAAGADQYITKPFGMDAILVAVERVLGT